MGMTTQGHKTLKKLTEQYGKIKAIKMMSAAIKDGAPGTKTWYTPKPEKTENKYTEALA